MDLFVSAVDPTEDLYDCIIIDGASRFECLEFCRNYVAKGGYLIVDNWGQEDFPHTKEALELLKGWENVKFSNSLITEIGKPQFFVNLKT